MSMIPTSKSEAYEDGVLTRMEGYNKQFNPFRSDKKNKLYQEWIKGWIQQNMIMIK